MSEVKTIRYQAVSYGKSYRQCLDILAFIKSHSPETKFDLVSGASDFDKLKSDYDTQSELLRKAVNRCAELEGLIAKVTRYDIGGYRIEKTFDEPRAWAVRSGSMRQSRLTSEFDFEPMPSNRTDEYVSEHTFTLEEAFQSIEALTNTRETK